MATGNSIGKAGATLKKKVARQPSGVISIGYSGKSLHSLKQLISPALEHFTSPILLTSPLPATIVRPLSKWLQGFKYNLKNAEDQCKVRSRMLYITPQGYRAYMQGECIRLEKQINARQEQVNNDRLASVLHDLNERVKEQTCLYGITKLTSAESGIEELLQKAVRLIPPGWQFPEHACCSIRYGKKEYKSAGFRKSRWCQDVRRSTYDGTLFSVTVYYKKQMPDSDEGPFLKYERSLLNSIADSLVLYISQLLVKNRSRLSERMLKEAQELALIANWSYDLVKKKSFWSDSMYAIFGVEPARFPKSYGAFFKLVVPEDRKRVEATMKQALRKGVAFLMEYCIKTSDGTKKYIEEKGYAEKDPSGRIIRLYGTVQDITQRKKTEQELADAATKYRSLFEASPVPSYIFDAHTLQLLDVNQRMTEQYGYSKEELLSMSINELAVTDQFTQVKAYLKKTKGNATVMNFGVHIHRTRDGKQKHVSISGTRHRIGERDCILELAQDITEQVLMEKLDQLERSISEMSLRGSKPLRDILENYLVGLEELIPGLKTSILQIRDGAVYNLVSPSLPAVYVNALNGLAIGPAEGSCGTAAYTGKQVIVTDIGKDPLWKKYKGLAQSSGLNACWSTPLFNPQGHVVATFANYYASPRTPAPIELEIFNRVGVLISILMESDEKEVQLHESNERFEFVTRATSEAIWDRNIITDKDFCGEGFSTIIGEPFPQEKWRFQEWLAYVHPEERQRVAENVEANIAGTGNRWELEYRVIRADKRIAYVSDRAYIIRDKQGKPVRMIGAIRDITAKMEEEQRLRLLENVVKNTGEAVIITRADPLDRTGPEIIYVNEAFTRMTGYAEEEVLYRTPRMFQGPKTDRAELSRLKLALRRGETCELSTINYTKKGNEFQVQMTIKPVFDDKGKLTHFFAIQRDITYQYKQQKQSRLMEIVSTTFKQYDSLVQALGIVLRKLVMFGDFTAAETWLLSPDKKHFNLVANFASTKEAKDYYLENKALNTLTPDGGLLKKIWEDKEMVIADHFDEYPLLRRKEGVRKAGFKSALAIPLLYSGELVGALTVLTDKESIYLDEFRHLFKGLESELGSEIRRKQLENELSLIFNAAPDIISVAGFDGYFKRINPAAATILGYTTEELLSRPYNDFIHPDFVSSTENITKSFPSLTGSNYFENCYISKSGKPVWLGWTYMQIPDQSLVFSVAKDITRQKELQRLLNDANKLARLGAWEVDLVSGLINWSEITREIHEVEESYMPVLTEGINFYREDVREEVAELVSRAIEFGESYDKEWPLITAKGNERWVRAICIPEFSNGKCIRLYGSFQDIHDSKMTEVELQQRTRYLSAIATVAQVFLSNEDWFDGVRNSFDLARYTMVADQIFYKEVYTDEASGELMLRQRLGWLKGQDQPQVDEQVVPPMPLRMFPEIYDVLMSDQHYATVFSELPDNALRQVLGPLGIQSVLFLPVFAGNKLEGVVGVEECTYERQWADGEIFFMRSLCSSLSAAIQRSRSNAALKEILEEKSEILESIGDGFFSVDEHWTVNYWNKQAELITRIPKEDILGRSIWDIFPIKQDTPGNLALRRAMETGEKGSYESFYMPLNIWVEGSIYPTRHGLTSYFKDVTVRKMAEEELRLSNERFEIVSEATNDAIRDWDIKEDILYWGKGYCRLFGYEEVICRSALDRWSENIHPEERKAVLDSLTATLADATHFSWHAEYRYQKADQTYAWVMDRGIIMRDAQGVSFRMVGSVADITYQKEYEKSLKKLNESLEKQTRELIISNAELEQFAYVASHDLQEPLRMITSFMTKLEDRYANQLDERGRRYIGFAVDGATRMRQNILGLLQYSRVGKGEAAPMDIDLNEVMEEVCLLHQADITEYGALIEVEPLPVVYNYMAPVVQLLNNLVSNAIKYRKPDIPPHIRVSATPEGEFWKIAVSDNGIGIEKEYLQKIFVIFQRLHPKEQYEGTGIGLAVVKKIVENLGGKVWVESTAGIGSTFYFTIRSVRE